MALHTHSTDDAADEVTLAFRSLASTPLGETIPAACLTIGGFEAFYTLVFTRGGAHGTASLLGAAGLLQLAIPALLRHGRVEAARTATLLAPSVTLATLSCLHGNETLLPVMFFALLPLPVLLYSLDEGRKMVQAVAMVLVGFLVAVLGGSVPRTGTILDAFPHFPAHIPPMAFAASVFLLGMVVTELQRREQVIRREMRHRRAAERDARQQRQQLQRTTEAQQAFIAEVSHEVRTPLNGVLGMVDVLTRTSLTRPQRAVAETLRGSADLLRVVVDDLVSLSLRDHRLLTLDPSPFLLAHTVEQVVESAGPAAEAKGLTLWAEIELRGDVEVVGDPTRLRQVLVHLLSNAIKFTPSGTVKVALSVEHRGREVGLALRIADTGRGMSPSELARRREVAPEAAQQGGVGLELCHRLISLMGGTLEIESRLGLGTCFTVRITLPTTGARVAEPDLRGMRVAVISENPRRTSALVNTLQRMNVCAEGSEHIRDLVGERWDFVLVDHPGPDLDHASAALGVAESRTLRLRASIGPNHHRSLHFPAPRSNLADALRSPSESGIREQGRGDASSPWFDQVHALIAEDNVVNRMVIQSFLTSMGVSCDVVHDGKEATEVFDAARHHIVFMDVMMPRMSGIEATAWIRSFRDPEGRVPIIATTADVTVDDKTEVLHRGFDEYLYKPLRRMALANTIRRFLPDRERTGHEARTQGMA